MGHALVSVATVTVATVTVATVTRRWSHGTTHHALASVATVTRSYCSYRSQRRAARGAIRLVLTPSNRVNCCGVRG